MRALSNTARALAGASTSLFAFAPLLLASAHAADSLTLVQAPLGGANAQTGTPAGAGDNAAATPDTPGAHKTVVIDDFENGPTAWTLNDPAKTKGAPYALLVGAVSTRADNPFLSVSQNAGLFTFKASQSGWASASRRVDGAQWAANDARRLTFYLAADGEARPNLERGVDLVLRAKVQGGEDEVFKLPLDPKTGKPIMVRLDRSRAWRQVVIPLGDFTSSKGPLTTDALKRVYLLQLVQTGKWDSRFFSLDQLQVDDQGAPPPNVAPPAKATPAPTGSVKPPTADPNATKISVDFKRVENRIAVSANVAVGASPDDSGGPDRAPLENADFRAALATLKPRFVRLDAGQLCELTNSAAPTFDFSRFQKVVGRVRSTGALPLIALTNPPAWALDAHGYAVFARGAALALNGRTKTPAATYYELNCDSVTFYNAARAALVAVNPTLRVGGDGSSAGDDVGLRSLLGGASGLEFLSLSNYGATSDEGDPFAEARTGARLRASAAILRASKFRNAALYVTRANVSPVSEVVGTGLTNLSAGAWWATYLGTASRIANQVFHEDGGEPDAGLLNASASAYPAYYAMYLWNTYFPSGSVRVSATSSRPQITVTAANTTGSHNVLLANTTAQEQKVQLSIRGFPVLRSARLHAVESRTSTVRDEDLPKSPYQTLTLKPYGVTVVQFIEGTPRRK